MNFKKKSIFHRGANDEPEQEVQAENGGMLAVWGSPGSGKTVAAVKLAKALADNRDRYFTNDLLYDLMCGIFDIRSNRYDPSQSLASADYCYQRADMLTYDNRIRVADDDLDKA